MVETQPPCVQQKQKNASKGITYFTFPWQPDPREGICMLPLCTRNEWGRSQGSSRMRSGLDQIVLCYYPSPVVVSHPTIISGFCDCTCPKRGTILLPTCRRKSKENKFLGRGFWCDIDSSVTITEALELSIWLNLFFSLGTKSGLSSVCFVCFCPSFYISIMFSPARSCISV